MVEVEDNGGLIDAAVPMDFLPGFSLEGLEILFCLYSRDYILTSGYPNRDSTIYGDLYGINSAHTLLRGTLRYKGYTDSIRGLVNLGLLNSSPDPVLHEKGPDLTWRQYMCHVCNQSDQVFYDNLREILLDRLESEKIVKTIEDLGLLSEEPISKKGTPIDTV